MIVMVLLLFCAVAEAGDLSNKVKVTDLNVETEKAFGTNRNYFIPEYERPSYYLNLNLNIELKDLGYVHQRVESIVGDSQFRNTGYRIEVGREVFDGVDLYIRHFSTHGLDYTPYRRFHEENAIGIRWNLIRSK